MSSRRALTAFGLAAFAFAFAFTLTLTLDVLDGDRAMFGVFLRSVLDMIFSSDVVASAGSISFRLSLSNLILFHIKNDRAGRSGLLDRAVLADLIDVVQVRPRRSR